MAFMTKTKKRSYRKGKKRAAAPRRRLAMRPPSQPIHYFKRNTYKLNQVTSSASVDTFQDVAFQLADVPNFTEFTAMYDQYQIQSIKYTILPRFNSATISDGVPETWTVVDHDGSVPSALSAYLQYPNLVIKRGSATHTRIFKPLPLKTVYNGLTDGFSVPSSSMWIDTANPNVPHFGLSIATPISGTSAPAWDVRVEYRLAFKSVR